MNGWLADWMDDAWMDLGGVVPDRCGESRTTGEVALLEVPSEDQYEGNRGS